MPGSVHSSGIPLSSSGWLTAGYMLSQADIEKWLAQLCRRLQPLHEQNCLYGSVAPDHILLDLQGHLQLASGPAVHAESRAAALALHDDVNQGYAAFEQYVDDPAWPQGPWTDIYGMSALARSLILKQSPPNAVQRMISDSCVPLHEMDLPDYSTGFLSTIDRGMSLLPQQRFASVDAFAEGLGLPPLAAGEDGKGEPVRVALPLAPVLASADEQAAERIATDGAPPPFHASGYGNEKKKAPVWMIACVVLALIATGAYLLREQNAGMQARIGPDTQETAAKERMPPLMPQADETDGTAIDPAPLIDMEAHDAAMTALLAAEQEAAAQRLAEQIAAQVEPVQADAEPVQKVDAKGEPAPEKPVGADIRVGLSIKPWGEVFVNGASRGVSPPLRSLSLKPGEYSVRIVNGDLPPQQQTLTLRPGETAHISHDFESGD